MTLRHPLSALALGALLLFTPLGAHAKEQSDHERKVRELLVLTGAAQMGQQVMDSMSEQFRSLPGLPPGFLDEFKKVAKPDDLVELVVPIYLENVSEADVDAAIAYWGSPAGQRMAQAMPKLNAEAMAAGQQWGTQLAEETLRRLAER